MAINGFDAYAPAEVAARVEAVGVSKAQMPLYRMAALAVLAGAFIALGGIYFLTATTDLRAGYGAGQVLGGLVFSLGLILVVVAGAELFTGNNLLVLAAVSGRITWWRPAQNWVVVFAGNCFGAIFVAAGFEHSVADMFFLHLLPVGGPAAWLRGSEGRLTLRASFRSSPARALP